MRDLLLRRARLFDRDGPVDVRVTAGVVSETGSALPEDGSEVLDCDDRMLLPGLWDEHVHMTRWALASRWISLAGARSAAEVVGIVRGAARAAGDEVVVGSGFQDALWPDRPTRSALDEAAGGRAVVLQSHDLHCVWVNTAAATRFGVRADESGLVREEPAFAIASAATQVGVEQSDAAVVEAGRAAAALGVVGVVDFEMAWNPGEWRRRADSGFDALRVEAAVYPRDLDRARDAGLRSGDALGDRRGLVRTGPLKALVDGALNTRTAYCFDPYPNGGGRGRLTIEPDALAALVARASRAGIAPAIHAIGDAAVAAVLDAYETLGVRGRIEHAQQVAPADVRRMGALGVTASVQPAHLLDDREVVERHWAGSGGRAFPLRALQDAGVALALGSDAPVAALDPWLAIRAAVERACQGEAPWHPEQALTPAAALAASARGRVRPEVGDAADLVLVEEPVERMHAGAVAATLLAGRFTHRRV